MGLTGALELGKSALLSYQSALQIVGNNIVNAGVDGYTRQTPTLTSLTGVTLAEGLMPGGGVALTALHRHMDEALQARLRSATSDQQNALAQQQALADIESLYGELSDSDLSSALSSFFNAFAAVQNAAGGDETTSARSQAITAGKTLSDKLQSMRSELLRMHDQLNSQIVDAVNQANDLAQQVADLNLEIVQAEAGGRGAAAALRDQRDGVLKTLSTLMDIQTIEMSNGSVSVYVGNEPLVQNSTSWGLTAKQELTDGRAIVSVHFTTNDGSVNIQSGQIAGLATSRDQHVYGQIQQLDSLAANLIQQVNRLHSQGQGLTGYSTITGSYDVLDPSAALNSANAGLTFSPTTGSFKLTVTTVTNAATNPPQTESLEYDIPVQLPSSGGGTSLNDLAAYITGAVPGVTATVTTDNRLQMTADSDKTFTFGSDTSGVLAALGINVFFTGGTAGDIAVESTLAKHPEYLAASKNGQPGDGSNAGAIADLGNDSKAAVGTVSIPARWRSIVAALAVVSGTAKNTSDALNNVSLSLMAQRESISGVNMDEETVRLMSYQRSFQASARYITMVDELVEEMLSMVR